MNDEEMRRVRGNEIAMIFQDPMTSLNPVLTDRPPDQRGARAPHGHEQGRRPQRRAIELLEMVGIPNAEERVDDYPHQFSGGMRQRVMIAMALSCNPKLLIADEPTTALDVTIQAQILDLMRNSAERARHGGDHDHPRPGRRRRHGRPHQRDVRRPHRRDGPTEELFANPRHPYTLGLLRSIPRLDAAAQREARSRSTACRRT